jgi:hypothetical protein
VSLYRFKEIYMKPNGTYLPVRKLLFVVCAVGLLAGLGKAETLHGRFQLPIEVHWGRIVLPADEYELTIDSGSRVVTVRSPHTSWTAMILWASTSDLGGERGSGLTLATSETGVYVEALYLGDLGVKLNFERPQGKLMRFVQSRSTPPASASGTH